MLTRISTSFPISFTLAIALAVGVISGQPAVAANAVAPEVATAASPLGKGPTLRQQRWLAASPEQRVALAEALGEDGARQLARSKGWTPIVDGTDSTLRQGFDQVYRSADDVVHVVEAKGGSGQIAHAYGYPQASPEWAVRAAERTLTSAKASAAEKDAAKLVINAARHKKLYVHVVRTRHVLGEPTVAVLEQTTQATDDAARLASSVADDLAARGIATADGLKGAGDDTIKVVGNVADDAARAPSATGTVAKVGRVAAKVAVPVAVTIDAGLRMQEGAEIERRFAEGSVTPQEREVAHGRNAAGMAGGWCGALAGAKLGAVGGGAAGTCVAPGPGTAIGAGAGGVAGGVAGYIGGEAAAEAAAEWTVTKVHDAGTTIADTASVAWDRTKETAQEAGQGCASAAAATWDGTKRATEATRGACGRTWSRTTSKASTAWDWAVGD